MNKEDVIRQIMGDMSANPGAPTGIPSVADIVDEKKGPSLQDLGLLGIDPDKVLDPSAGGMTEFIRYEPLGYSSGYVIANLDPAIHDAWGWDKKYRSIGILSSRFTAAPFALAADDAVKATNTTLLHLEAPNEPMAHGARGSLFIFGAEDVSDARRVIELTLDGVKAKYFGGVGLGGSAAYDIQWSANAGPVLCHPYLMGDLGKAWGFMDGVPKAMGILMLDAALKSANVKLKGFHALDTNSYSNEFTAVFVGDSGAVLQAVRRAREVAEDIMRATGDVEPFHLVDTYY